MKRTKLAIIGNGMATGKLLEELDRRHAFANMDVSVFGEEPHGAYNRIMLDRILKGEAIAPMMASVASVVLSASDSNQRSRICRAGAVRISKASLMAGPMACNGLPT